MRSKILLSSLLAISLVSTTACTPATEEVELSVSGSTSALSSIHLVMQRSLAALRPGPSLGVYVALYLAQGIYLPAHTALTGIDAQWDMIQGAGSSTEDEVFLILEELGQLLQTNVPDMLNRSADRPEALNKFVDALRSATKSADQKRKEFIVLLDEQENTTREENRKTKDLEKEVRTAVKNEDYGTAGSLQQELIAQKGVEAEAESNENQTSDVLESYDDLLDVAIERLNAIDKNRDAILAGVTVIDVPGIDDLRLVEKARRSRNLEDEILDSL